MRMIARDKKKMWYSLYLGSEPIYELDDDGNKIVAFIDDNGDEVYRKTGERRDIYSSPIEFYASLSMSGGEAEAVEYGINLSDYSATIVVPRDSLPIDETSRIWRNSKPQIYADGTADEHSADYIVVKKSQSPNIDKYILQTVVK